MAVPTRPRTGLRTLRLGDMILGNILGPDALVILILAVVLIFGANRLPKMARNIGEASKEFKKAQDEAHGDTTPELKALGAGEKVTMTRGELDALLASSNHHVARPPSGQSAS